MNVWIFQTGEPLHCDVGSARAMRGMNLADALVERGHRVVLWSSSFNHQEKKQRALEKNRLKVSDLLGIRLVESPGYKRNIGLSRLWDHATLGHNLIKELEAEETLPDVAFVGYPPIETAAAMTRWLGRRKVPCLVDVKDQWPQIFLSALPSSLRFLGRLGLAPYIYYGRRSLQGATGLTAMSDNFLEWAVGFAGRNIGDFDRVVPLTTDVGKVSKADLDEARGWWDRQGIFDDGTPRICFIGSHSKAFDMEPVFQAAQSMASAGNSCQFVLCGSGERSSVWRQRAAGLSNVFFPGWIDRAKIEALARRSMAGLAPYYNSDDFILSIPNKVLDYMGLGLPILSSLSGEVGNLISRYNVGLGYGPMFGESLEKCIYDLSVTPGLFEKISKNSTGLFNEKYGFVSVYGGLVSHLEMLAQRR